jgi:hypothetical protein
MYVGKLHVLETDYAVLRTDYVLDEGEKLSNMKFLWELKYQRMLVKESFTNKEPKTIVTCSMPKQWKLLLSQSPIETYRVNKRRKDIL